MFHKTWLFLHAIKSSKHFHFNYLCPDNNQKNNSKNNNKMIRMMIMFMMMKMMIKRNNSNECLDKWIIRRTWMMIMIHDRITAIVNGLQYLINVVSTWWQHITPFAPFAHRIQRKTFLLKVSIKVSYVHKTYLFIFLSKMSVREHRFSS